jgi:hypothetical protein
MKDPVTPAAPITGVDEEEAKAELVRALAARADAVVTDSVSSSALAAPLAAQIPPPAVHKCTRPHIDEMQMWNPPYKPGGGPTN